MTIARRPHTRLKQRRASSRYSQPMHPACLSDESLLKECDLTRGRASGPGGQHRNKVETAVVLVHTRTGIRGQASERRSQNENKRLALRRLRLNLATHYRTRPHPDCKQRNLAPTGAAGPAGEAVARADTPTALWLSRREGRRIVCSPQHHDFPSLLAEAMNVIAEANWAPTPAAEHLGVSTSQLIKFIRDHPPAFELWNAQRAELGLHSLR